MRKLGATGRFPQGKLYPDDEGELRAAITADHHNQVVRIEFGKSVAWVSLGRKGALEFADAIRKKAEEL
jgi:hypothetical protein